MTGHQPRRLIDIAYNTLLFLALPLLGLYVIYRRLRGRPPANWAERMGYLPVSGPEPVVWVHAVSAGEMVAADAIIRAIRRRLPNMRILCTTGTPEGRATGVKRLADVTYHIGYVPYDLPWAVSRAMRRVRPRLFVLVESELWPNTLQAAASRGVPVLLANGHVSERTLRRGGRAPALYRWIFSNVHAACMQSEAMRQRAMLLGARPETTHTVGSVKYDQVPASLSEDQVAGWRALFGIAPDEPVFLAGSTHPGEEQQVLDAYSRLRAAGVNARLILAPRHPQRAEEVEGLVRAAGYEVVRRSHLGNAECRMQNAECRMQNADRPAGEPIRHLQSDICNPVILLDTMGELASLFSLATVVFLGGSLMPIGGHDILQPLVAGKPVLLGPHTDRQRDTVQEALAEGVAWEVANSEELARRAVDLFAEAVRPNDQAARAVHFVESRRGASERCAEEAQRLVEEWEAARAEQAVAVGSEPLSRRLIAYFVRVMEGEERGAATPLVSGALRVFSWAYLAAIHLSIFAHRNGLRRRARAACPVISVGNLSSGGTGKSTATAMLAEWLIDAGLRCAILSRGYRAKGNPALRVVSDGRRVLAGPEEGGDEPVMLARRLPGVPVIVGRRRPVIADAAVEQFGVDVCLLDDGFQVWNLAKDLDIVLLDARRAFHNGFVLPRGMLREPPRHLGRAGVVLLMDTERVDSEALAALRERVRRLAPRADLVEACRVPERLWNLHTGEEVPLSRLQGLPVVALSAIGNPHGFEALLRSLGASVHGMRLPDHHTYTPADLAAAEEMARATGAAAIITTEKDSVKLHPDVLDLSPPRRAPASDPADPGETPGLRPARGGGRRAAGAAGSRALPEPDHPAGGAASAGGEGAPAESPVWVLTIRLRILSGEQALRERVLAVARKAQQ